jgi:hypothetical protein
MSAKQRYTHGDHEFGGLELPESDIDGDTTLTLGLEFVEHPSYDSKILADRF